MKIVIRKSVNLESKGDKTSLSTLAKKTGLSMNIINKQHEMGMSVEMEHTKDSNVAHQIAMDHMEEDIYYYKKLKESGLADELTKSKKPTTIILKSKYIKRTGSPGNYKYIYKEGKEGASIDETKELVPPDKFDAKAYFHKTNDPNATVESVMQGASQEVKDKIAETEKALKEVTPTIENFRKSGEGAAAVYSPEREKLHAQIISKMFTSEKIKGATPAGQPELTILGGRGGCLSLDHEYLTKDGWKKISNYTEGEDVLIFDAETGTTKFEIPERYIDLPCENFYHIKSRGIDLMVSEEHKILYNKKFNPEKWRTIKASELAEKHLTLKDGWDGMIPCSFPAPDNVEGVKLSDDELRLMVAICADGSFELKTTKHCRMSFRKDRKKERIEMLLDNCGIEYKISYSKKRLTEDRYSFYSPENNKSLSAYWGATPEQLKIIAEEVIYWDGWTGKDKEWLFSSTNKEDIDFINYVFSTQGRRSSFYRDDREGTGWSPIWRVSAGTNKGFAGLRGGGPSTGITEVKSVDGRKYCFTVSTGYFITRRNDCICITGNSGKSWFNGKVYDPSKAIVLDSDEIKGQLPEYKGWNAFEVHEESSDILEKAEAMAKAYGLNIVIDATMKSTGKAVARVKTYVDKGYDIKAHYMHAPRQVSAQRAVKRFGGKSGRYVPVGVVLSNVSNEATFDAVKPFASSWSFLDSSGTPPPDLISKKNGALKMLGKAIATESPDEKSNPDPYDLYDFGNITNEKDYSPTLKDMIEKNRPKKMNKSRIMIKKKGLIKSAIDYSEKLRRLYIRRHGTKEANKQLKIDDKEDESLLRHMNNIGKPQAEYDRKYKLEGRVNWNGLNIAIENKKGSYRSGTDINGKPWKTLMAYDYGRIGGTKATDGEATDIYLGEDDTSDMVYVVHQVDPFNDYKYDEDKCMCGFPSRESAITAYQSQYNRPDFLGEVSEFTIPEFKQSLIDNRGRMLYRSPNIMEEVKLQKIIVRKR